MYLYPRLPLSIASSLAAAYSKQSLEQLRDSSAVSPIHSAARYAPTGGNRVGKDHLLELQAKIRTCADKFGYPNSLNVADRQGFDATVSIVLHQQMQISPSEASNLTMWAHMTCVLLPDTVRWRFPGEEGVTPEDRFIGSARGLRRNTFGRLWWRAYLLHESEADNPYSLLTQLNEDELVQITERPSLAGSLGLVRQIYYSFFDVTAQYPHLPRRDLLRDAVKRVRRLSPIMLFDVLDSAPLRSVIDDIFEKAALSLEAV